MPSVAASRTMPNMLGVANGCMAINVCALNSVSGKAGKERIVEALT